MTGPGPSNGSPAIDVWDLVKTYRGGVQALRGVSFQVEAGSVFALLGPNGAGKSTTVKILTTLSRPDSGTARVAGIDVLRDPFKVRCVIGCVAQKSTTDLEATGKESLTLQGQLYGFSGPSLRSRVSDLLERFALTEAANRLTRTYSGGMQRKLDVAMGLINRPRVLFLDEPTTGLDPETRAGMWGEIRRLSHEEGLTILLTTHYLEEADRLAGCVAIVDRGRIVVQGPPEELKAELRGDAVHVELAEPTPQERVQNALRSLGDSLRDVAVDGRMLHARADSGAEAVPAVLGALDSEGIVVASVTVARPSLDDVYLRYTGRSFKDADQEESR
ncbi:MAG: ATP-binding cassette domain-containing protein [Dehalococcoidia bacterium]